MAKAKTLLDLQGRDVTRLLTEVEPLADEVVRTNDWHASVALKANLPCNVPAAIYVPNGGEPRTLCDLRKGRST